MPTMKINEVDFYYEDEGPAAGIPLVMVHGWTADRRRWDHQFEHLAKRMRVIRYDLRGHGLTRGAAGNYTIEQNSRDLLAILARLNIRKAYLAGHSMGGMTVQRFALDYPAMVEKLVLVDTLPRTMFGVGRRLLSLGSLLLPYKLFTRINIMRAFKKGFPRAKVREFVRLSQRNDKRVVQEFFEDMKKWNVSDKLSRIKARTLVVHGIHDIRLPFSQGVVLAAGIPNAVMKALDCGHESPLEKPAELTEAMGEFLT